MRGREQEPVGFGGLHPATRAAWTGLLSEPEMETGEKAHASLI